MKAWPRVLVVGVVLVGGSLGVGLWWKGRGKSDTPQFVTANVTRGDVTAKVTATGTLSATVTVQVGTQVSGRIQTLSADFNSQVKKGEVLATLDPQLFNAALAQTSANEKAALANVARAKAQLADSERKLRRATELAAQKLIAQADLDAAQADEEVAKATIDAAEAAVAQARAQRQQAQVNLGYTVITSPIDGTIISRAVDVGQTVAASLQSPTVFTIAENLTAMQVHTNVAEADVGKLKQDLVATFTVDAFPNRRFTGRIRQIRYAAQVVSNVVTYDAVLDVENPELVLRPGMTANVTFITQEAKDVLKVPNAALRFRFEPMGKTDEVPAPKPGTRAVTVLREGKPQRVAVATGVTDGSFTEVVSGLEEGEAVVTDRSSGASGGANPQRSGGQQRGAGPGGPPTRLF
jgi:HlyD family secretion protein